MKKNKELDPVVLKNKLDALNKLHQILYDNYKDYDSLFSGTDEDPLVQSEQDDSLLNQKFSKIKKRKS